jgi:hypothetical protein
MTFDIQQSAEQRGSRVVSRLVLKRGGDSVARWSVVVQVVEGESHEDILRAISLSQRREATHYIERQNDAESAPPCADPATAGWWGF